MSSGQKLPRCLSEQETENGKSENWSMQLLYLVDNGCKWRALPHDFPPYSTVHSFYRRARLSGLWDRILEHLVEVTRKRAKRNSTPSYALIDSQSAKTVYASEQIGYDGGKKTKEESGIS